MSIMKLATHAAKSPVIFIARMMLRMMNPGPASLLLVGISSTFSERLKSRKETVAKKKKNVSKERMELSKLRTEIDERELTHFD